MANTNNKRQRSESSDNRPKKRSKLLEVTPNDQQLEIAQKNQQQSPLLRLPREIRDLIWSFVFPGTVLSENCWAPSERGIFQAYEPMSLATLQVSRQIYSETRFLPWQQNLFDIGAGSLKWFLLALRKLNAACREQIFRIRVTVLNRSWLPYSRRKYCEGLGDLNTLLPNLKQITVSPMDSADVDGSDPQRTMLERVRVVREVTRQYFPDIEYAVEGFSDTVSERTKLVILGLEIK